MPTDPTYDGPWRHPAEESHLYPGLCLSDNRVSGSITVGCTRLPLWAISSTAIRDGWDAVEAGWSPSTCGYSEQAFADFVNDLLEQRGEFGRLLLVLADAERTDTGSRPWWTTKKHRQRVGDQLARCMAALDAEAER